MIIALVQATIRRLGRDPSRLRIGRGHRGDDGVGDEAEADAAIQRPRASRACNNTVAQHEDESWEDEPKPWDRRRTPPQPTVKYEDEKTNNGANREQMRQVMDGEDSRSCKVEGTVGDIAGDAKTQACFYDTSLSVNRALTPLNRD
jgi:hypothetical protein